MDGLGYACAVLLAAVFVRAGAAKLARPASTVAGFTALGVPAAAISARAVPFVELTTAAALLAAPRVGAAAGLFLLALFTGLLARAVRTGSQAPCNCFGAARADPVSRVDLVRNALLAGLAVLATAAARPVVPGPAGAAVALAAFLAGVALLASARRRYAATGNG